MPALRTLTILLLTCGLTAVTAGENWNQFRGPHADGTSRAKGLPVEFSEDNATWKVPLPGRAWSSPVVWEDQVWVTNAPEIQNPPGATNREANAGDTTPLKEPVRLSAMCLDVDSGEVIHDVTVFDIYRPQFTHETNSYASPTPFVEEGHIYVHFGTYGTACLDTASGEKIWERRDLNVIHWRGPGSSPVVHGDLVFLSFDGYDRQFIAALNKHTGDTVWMKDRDVDYGTDNGDLKKAYSTPTVISVDGRDLLISPFAMATIAYDLKTGDTVWKVRHGGMNAAARPLFGNGLVYVNAGDGRDALVAIRPDGQGDITETHIAWRLGRLIPKRPSQLLVGDRYYMVDDGGVASCLNAKTGEIIWKGRVGGKFWASPLYAEGRIYCFSQEGKVAVLNAGDTFEIIASSKLDDGFNASPAVAGSSIILRSFTHLYRFDDQ